MLKLKISGMTCGSCATQVEKALSNVAGVQSAAVSSLNETANVVTDKTVDIDVLTAAVEQSGYQARLIGDDTARDDVRDGAKPDDDG